MVVVESKLSDQLWLSFSKQLHLQMFGCSGLFLNDVGNMVPERAGQWRRNSCLKPGEWLRETIRRGPLQMRQVYILHMDWVSVQI